MKISNKVRAEAIEFAGCMATCWACDDDEGLFSPYVFLDGARALASAAFLAADYERDGLIWLDMVAHRWAEAQAMLLDGWTP
jgi:hypothetical protein